MASASLGPCSSLTTHGWHSRNQKLHPCVSGTRLCLTSRIAPALSFPNLAFCPVISSRLALSSVPKSTESEAPVVEAEPDSPLDEPTTDAEGAGEKPKREDIFAVVMVGGRQYIVFPGRYIYTQRLKGAKVNDKITLNKVLLIGTRTKTWMGAPVVANAVVHATVEEQGLDAKVIVFKYKRKKNYRRNIGHRQPNSRIRITAITGYQDSPFLTLDDGAIRL